jgi:hypothetical protein
VTLRPTIVTYFCFYQALPLFGYADTPKSSPTLAVVDPGIVCCCCCSTNFVRVCSDFNRCPSFEKRELLPVYILVMKVMNVSLQWHNKLLVPIGLTMYVCFFDVLVKHSRSPSQQKNNR